MKIRLQGGPMDNLEVPAMDNLFIGKVIHVPIKKTPGIMPSDTQVSLNMTDDYEEYVVSYIGISICFAEHPSFSEQTSQSS